MPSTGWIAERTDGKGLLYLRARYYAPYESPFDVTESAQMPFGFAGDGITLNMGTGADHCIYDVYIDIMQISFGLDCALSTNSPLVKKPLVFAQHF